MQKWQKLAGNWGATRKYLWVRMNQGLLAMYYGSGKLIMPFEYAGGRLPVAMTRNGRQRRCPFGRRIGGPALAGILVAGLIETDGTLMQTQSLIELALTLPPDEKFLLVDTLLKSLDEPDAALEAVWLEETQQRLVAHREGRLEAVPMEEVFKDLVKDGR